MAVASVRQILVLAPANIPEGIGRWLRLWIHALGDCLLESPSVFDLHWPLSLSCGPSFFHLVSLGDGRRAPTPVVDFARACE